MPPSSPMPGIARTSRHRSDYGASSRKASPNRSGDAQGIMQEAPEARAPAAHGGAVAFDPRKAPDQLADRDLRLHAGERHAGTGMNSRGEGEMTIGLPADIEALGIGELRGIAVRRADPDMDISAGRHGDAAELAVPCRAAIAELVRAFHAQTFLDGAVEERGIVAQLAQ